ncbi:MAG TPA: glycosyltransferase family 2 protein [Drouetiella sp.]
MSESCFPELSVSVVIPCYNSQASLPQLLANVSAVLADTVLAYEIICVNDSSSDQTWKVLSELVQQYPLQAIDLMRNYGQQNALLCGIRAARHEVIVTLDDDLQNPPSEIPKLLSKLVDGYDVVYGTPAVYRQSFLRSVTSRAVRALLRSVLKVEAALDISSFRAFRTCLREGFSDFRSPCSSLDVLLTWATTKATAVTVEHHSREFGKSKYSWCHLMGVAVNLMTSYSLLPLRLAAINGAICLAIGSIVLVGLFVHQMIFAYGFGGVSLLAAIICFLSGVQLISIGVLGEYLARIHASTISQPPYLIKTTQFSYALDHLPRLVGSSSAHSQHESIKYGSHADGVVEDFSPTSHQKKEARSKILTVLNS